MIVSVADLVALIGAITALVVALAGVVYQIRMMRQDIVQAVAEHKNETIEALLLAQKRDGETRTV